MKSRSTERARTARAVRLCALAILAALASAVPARAQWRVPRRVIPTTIVIERPLTALQPLDPRVIWLGVDSRAYGFVLRDGYTDVSGADSVWNSIWQSARPFRPNFHVLGDHMQDIARIKPGETVTLKGIYVPMMRAFEITEVIPGVALDPPRSF